MYFTPPFLHLRHSSLSRAHSFKAIMISLCHVCVHDESLDAYKWLSLSLFSLSFSLYLVPWKSEPARKWIYLLPKFWWMMVQQNRDWKQPCYYKMRAMLLTAEMAKAGRLATEFSSLVLLPLCRIFAMWMWTWLFWQVLIFATIFSRLMNSI